MENVRSNRFELSDRTCRILACGYFQVFLYVFDLVLLDL